MASFPGKIVLNLYTPGPETRSFNESVIKIGRNPNACHIAFDSAQWPMVSRYHAELRKQNGSVILADCGSSFGTYLNGERITEPSIVEIGAHLQFGTHGPLIQVVAIEDEAEETTPAGAVTKTASSTAQDSHNETTAPHLSQATSAPTLELLSDSKHRQQSFALTKDVLLIGRDYDSDIRLDANSIIVSKHHAKLLRRNSRYYVADLSSFNGTLVNGKRITTPTELSDDDQIQLGSNGPTLVLHDPSHVAPPLPQDAAKVNANVLRTMYVGQVSASTAPLAEVTSAQIFVKRHFNGSQPLTIGRAESCDISLDGLQISNTHARISLSGGGVMLEDSGSTNGVYLNGERITAKTGVRPSDIIQIGPFVLNADAQQGVTVFDTRAKTRIDAVGVTKVVRNNSGAGTIKLLDSVNLVIQPNEFVGLLGPSGAGKSTLMDSLNGMRPATEGKILINNLDLYQHLDSLKQAIGYVPQDDIIHRELTVYRTLYYVAKLRLSRDVTNAEVERLIGEVMDATGLTERRDVHITQLSGGQRKRVSIAVELVTKPSVIFLDEPTSGLDPATEEKIMRLFRQIAESGRTVILTTHAMENVKLFDKLVVMMRGKLVFYGTPQEALSYTGADSFKDLYDKLEAPISERMAKLPALAPSATPAQKLTYNQSREQIVEQVAEEWKQKFTRTTQYEWNIWQPMSDVQPATAANAKIPKQRTTAVDRARQWLILARRYLEVTTRDKFNLLILFAQAPIIAVLTYLVVGANQARDFPFFMLALVAVWFGASVSAREIIKERAIYNRERMVNLGLLPYVGSKLLVLAGIVGLQSGLLFGTLKVLHFAGLMHLPGNFASQLGVMQLTGFVGIALGLLISSAVKTSEMATSLVPLILIPQILFSGLVGVPEGVSRYVGAAMPATWAFDAMKRFSSLDTLSEEGSRADGENEGQGLYKHVERVNDRNIMQARQDVTDYQRKAEDENKQFKTDLDDYVKRLKSGQSATQPRQPALDDPPPIRNAVKIPDDLKSYVNFLHPWGGGLLDVGVLLFMFTALSGATIIVLRTQDIG